MTPREAFELGVTLDKALDKFGKLQKFRSQPYTPPYPAPKPEDVRPEDLKKVLSNFVDILTEPGRQLHAAEEEIKQQLTKGTLLGVGFVPPRSVTDTPTAIPSDLWALAKFNYDKSEIQSGSLKFENVRIAKLPANEQVTQPAPVGNVYSFSRKPRRPVGRPTSQDKIREAYEELKASDDIDFAKPMSHAYPLIQDRLAAKYNTDKGFKDEAVRKAISDDFHLTVQAHKSARKL